MTKDIAVDVKFTKDELLEFTNHCLDFTEIFCATEFYEYQREFGIAIIVDIIDSRGNTLTGLFSRQSGKSETIANISAAMMVLLPQLANLKKNKSTYMFPQLRKFRRGLFVGIFTPSDNQSITTYKRAQGKLISKDAKIFFNDPDFCPEGYDKLLFVQNNNQYLELNNGSHLQMMSASKQANIESKSYHLILLDESQDLDEFVVNKSIMPMAAAYNGTSVGTGTPGTTKGFFYNTIQFNKAEQLRPSMQQLHFEYDYKVCQKYNPDYKKYIDKQRRKLSEDSDEFRMSYRLHWLLERGMAISEDLFDQLTIKSRNITTSLMGVDLVAGLDFGKSGDSTVLTVGMPKQDEQDESGRCPVDIIYWWEKLGDDYEQIFKELKDEVAKFSINVLAVDSTGVGEPLADRLMSELPHITILPVKFTAQSKDHLYKNFLVNLQEKRCTWPGDSRVRKRRYFQLFEHQMLNLRKEYKNGYLRCSAPEDVKNAHDDFPDSLALCLWTIYEDAMPYVQVSSGKDMWQGINWRQHPQKNVPQVLR